MKNLMKTLASILVFSIILQTAVIGFEFDDLQRNPDSKSNSSPYALMYDSNEKLAKKIESMPDISTEVQVPEESEAPSKGKPASEVATEDADGRIMDKDSKKELLDIVSTGELDKISELDISDEMKAEIEEMNESVKADRFIVKYSSETKGSMPSLIAKESDKYKVSNNERSGKTELLILDEKVNPKEFADTLKNAGADSYIEYIQPDFKLEYAATENGIGLVLSEVEPSVSVEGDEPDAAESVDEQQDDNVEIESPVVSASPELPTEPVVVPEEITPEVIVIPTETPLPEQLSEVIVAVIDTGIDVAHPGLADYIWNNTGETDGDGIDNDGNGFIDDVKGWNFYDDSNAVYDSEVPLQSAHGTHIAGIIAAANEEYNVKIMPLKVFGDSGAYTSNIIDAIHYAEANGARIVNCSFGSTDNNPALSEAIESSDMLFVCAVGNARSDLAETPIYPACFDLDNIISVTSTNADGGLSYYSNHSSETIDVAALGRDVNSTLPGGEYGIQSGTSMSAAQVSGVAAATLCVQDDLQADSLKQRLINTSDMLSNLQETVIDGRQINLDNAVSNLEQTEITENNPADDFDVNGYSPTQSELYELYSSSGDIVQVAAGGYFTLVLKEDGTVWAWGNNDNGQCGNGTTSNSVTLTQVIGLTNVVNIAAGGSFCLAVKSDGTVWAWGHNLTGQLGNGTIISYSTPVQVSGLTGVIQVAAGLSHSLAVKSDGTVWAWGLNNSGQLGNGTIINWLIPVQVSGLTGITQVAAGYNHSLAVKSDGTVRAWGFNGYGELGNGSRITRITPVQVSGLTGVIQVAAGSEQSLAVKSDGTARAWGYNNYGQLGDGTTTYRTTSVQVSGLTDVIQVAAGLSHSLATKSDGTVWAWGYNNYGQLGDGSTTNRSAPVQVSSLAGVIRVSVGYSHSLSAKPDGTVWAWGYNNYGQLGDGTTLTGSYTPIQSQTFLPALAFLCDVYSASITNTIETTVTVTAQATNGYGEIIEDADITYSLAVAYAGVSINSSTGVVTVTHEATEGSVQINATYGDLSCSTALTLVPASNTELYLSATTGHQYYVNLTASNVSSFAGQTYTLTYDETVLEVIDLCAFTHELETTTGAISRTGITITSFSPGEIVFTIDKTIPAGKAWSGVLSTVKFKALTTQSTTISAES